MIPFEDQPNRTRRRFPIVTLALLVLNVVVFIYELSLSQPGLDAFIRAWALTPGEISTGRDLPPLISLPVYATLITSLFIHGGFLHIASNMLFLWVFGDNVEDALGHGTFLVVYLVAGIAAGLTQTLSDPGSLIPALGASGAIAGVLAGYLVLYPRAEVRSVLFFGPFVTVGRVAALLLIGFWFGLQVVHGFFSLGVETAATGVAYFAHIGGFLAGLLLTPAIRIARGQQAADLVVGRWAGPVFRNWLIVVVVLAVLFGVDRALAGSGDPAAAMVFQGAVLLGAAAFALVDAWLRIRGRRAVLGSGTGLGRLTAFVQIVVALGVLAAALAGL